ncbi:MAG TPA: SGNH hydrolase domain-containing protein, partial [Methylophilus sp.]
GGDMAQAPSLSLQHYLERNAGVFEVFNHVREIQYIDPRQLFCDAATCRSTDTHGHPLYSDTNHVNQYGALPIAEKISDRILVHP